ncbi:Uncharacterised protein [Yersinia wautersii]|uniref:Uncharacterized protein n=1 Tax=Yersinia wautersii TaxID=1341643 RepID=A0ABP1ZKQ6_9GAMM|nr:Uncharacterised protein [Yersinia wautersii]
MLGGADNTNGELPSYITGADKCEKHTIPTSPYALQDIAHGYKFHGWNFYQHGQAGFQSMHCYSLSHAR